jgi:HTH-type transcriptional regulator/antitoxin MqsA
MKCPHCDDGHLVYDIRSIPYTYKGKTTLIHDVVGDYCRSCKEIIHIREHGHAFHEHVRGFRDKVDADARLRARLRKIRTGLGLSRSESGSLLGGGAQAFAGYEGGEAEVPEALVTLLLLLERRPELVRDVRELRVERER